MENLDAMFDDMLGELDIISQQLEDKSEKTSPPKVHTDTKRESSSSHSSAVEHEVDVDLNAMLNDLTDWEVNLAPPSVEVKSARDENRGSGAEFNSNSLSRDAGKLSVQHVLDVSPQFSTLKRSTTDGPSVTFGDDDDLSLESLAKDIDQEKRQLDKSRQLSAEELAALSPEAREERIKAEKMRIALEKLKEARIQKLVVKVFNKDDSSKTLVVDERMTTRSVIKQLLEKNHYEPSVNWALVEELPSLYMERIFEEHESVTEMLAYWTRDTANQVRFLERKDKYALFRNPQHYLLSVSDTEGQMAERQKQTLIEEFFSGRSGTGVPEVQGILHIKGESKSWSRKYCVLRNSGLYCSKSGEPKKGKKPSDLQCLVMFESVCVYLGRGWKKKHKSPTDYGFALKHPAIQTKSKHIRYFCCDDVRSLMRWIVGIRCAKYGKQLKDNFDRTNSEMKGLSDMSSIPYHPQPPDSTASSMSGSGETGNEVKAVPRASITNVFGGAWQRANQQEQVAESPHEEGLQRAKSVWNPNQSKAASSNWWDLGASPELEELAENPTDRTSYKGTEVEPGSAAQESHIQAPPPPTAHKPPLRQVMQPPPPPMKIAVPPSQRRPSDSQPPPFKNVPPPPPMKTGSRMPPKNLPPPPGPKPPFKPNSEPLPPPPGDDLPPPPPMDDMPPPPPMEDLPPPPPMDDDMPLPPPMELSANPGLPKGLQTTGGPAPVRLPFLPMFKNGNPLANLRHATPHGARGPPPPPKNFNSSNNIPPVVPREPQMGHARHNQRKSIESRNRASSNEAAGHSRPGKYNMVRPPLTDYYTSDTKRNVNALYSTNDLPPPPEFIVDLKDTFHNVSSSHQTNDAFDLPPPPPELLLNEVRNRQPMIPKGGKPPPPPPKRSPSTRLSFKRS